MQLAELKKSFFTLVPSHPPNGWEIEEHLESIIDLPAELQELVLSKVPAIWSVSHSLCYSYMSSVGDALDCLSTDHLNLWVGDILDIYEKEGLRSAQNFMNEVEKNFLCRVRGETGLDFNSAASRLTSYARSIAERRISLAAGPVIYTDTETIFLPVTLNRCRTATDNFLLYKLIVTFQLGIIRQSTYEFSLPAEHEIIYNLFRTYKTGRVSENITLENFFSLFPDRQLAEDIFTLSEGLRVSRYLASSYPGLWRDTEKIRAELAASRSRPDRLHHSSGVMEELACLVISGGTGRGLDCRPRPLHEKILAEFIRETESAADSAASTVTIFAMLYSEKGHYTRVPPVYFQGRLNPGEARKGMLRRRLAVKEEFIKTLATVMIQTGKITEKTEIGENDSPGGNAAVSSEEGISMIMSSSRDQGEHETDLGNSELTRLLILENQQAELPESLRRLAERITADLGGIPAEYISAAQGMAGRANPPSGTPGNSSGESLAAPITYDEWDFRRNGFRKNWCLLNEKNLQPVKGTFIAATLDRYRGVLKQLKNHFEMLRRTDRFLKRQRDGDDIDLDGLIESIADTQAGRPQSERLFIRLQRDERDIAVLFLVDMSSSTEGWINQALKEALILMSESLKILGDRFAIYGFSGMRRTRTDFYRVKDFEEQYNDEIKGRIAAIGPQEYTRMGPPLRHATELLQNIDARVRLLVTLSDGKPEDYDDYKGEYAIEDTRHALIEAKARGIHPFCITIDKKAHDYIGHMYGEVNYIFVDEVRKLPVRLPEIYRTLTT